MQPVKLMSHDDTALPLAPAYVRAARLSLARSHRAQFPARLALARWTSGSGLPHLAGSTALPARAAWFDRAQRDFQAWLDNGGFVQHEDAAETWPIVQATA